MNATRKGWAARCRAIPDGGCLAGQYAGEFGIPFKAGEVILSGSLAPLIPVVAGMRCRWRSRVLAGVVVGLCNSYFVPWC